MRSANWGMRVLGHGAAAAMAFAALMITAGAQAATRSQTTTLTVPYAISSLTPQCPRGQRATGGGYRASEPAGVASPTFFVTESRKIGQRSWRVSGFKSSPPGAVTLTAYVICDSEAPKTKERIASLVINGDKPVDASCGSAGRAQSGGFSSVGNPAAAQNIFLGQSFRFSKKTWRTMAGIEAGAPPTLVTHVYCAEATAPKPRSATVSVSGMNVKAFPTSLGCKRGTKVFAGGVRQSPQGSGGSFAFPWEFAPLGRAWRIGAFHFGTGANLVTPIAYCG